MSTAYLDALYQDVLMAASPSIVLDALYQDVLIQTGAVRMDALYQDALLSTEAIRMDSLYVDVLIKPASLEEEIPMRVEHQRWDKIQVLTEIITSGVGQTGLTVACVIQRKSDDQWLQSGGGWGVSASSISMTEVDATNMPGMYEFQVDSGDIDFADADDGYFVSISEGTTPHREHLFIDTSRSAHEFRMLGLRQSNMIVVDSTWDANGMPTSGTVYLYANATDANTDYGNSNTGLAIESYSYTVDQNSVTGVRERYVSVKN